MIKESDDFWLRSSEWYLRVCEGFYFKIEFCFEVYMFCRWMILWFFGCICLLFLMNGKLFGFMVLVRFGSLVILLVMVFKFFDLIVWVLLYCWIVIWVLIIRGWFWIVWMMEGLWLLKFWGWYVIRFKLNLGGGICVVVCFVVWGV